MSSDSRFSTFTDSELYILLRGLTGGNVLELPEATAARMDLVREIELALAT